MTLLRPTRLHGALATSLCAAALVSGCGGGGGGSSSAVGIRTVNSMAAPVQPDWTGPDAQYQASAASTHQAAAAYDAGLDGDGVWVGVLDSGVSGATGALDGRLFLDSRYSGPVGSGAARAGDSSANSHGTGVATIIAAQRGGTAAMHGVAPKANIVDYNVAASTPGFLSYAKINAALTAAGQSDVDVVNLSAESARHVGEAADGSESVMSGLRAATDAGVVVVIAAGNDHGDHPSILGGLPLYMNAAYRNDPGFDLDQVLRRVITVAALNADGAGLAGFSNKCGDARAFCLSARGVDVRMIDKNGAGQVGDGTSFAAPLVAGAFALLRQMWPQLGEEEIVEIILRTADDIGAAGVDEVFGYGRLNVARAVAPVGNMSLPQESPATQYDGAGAVYAAAAVVASPAMAPALTRLSQGGAAIAAFDSYGRGFRIPMAAFAREAERVARAREDFGAYVNRHDAVLETAPGVTLRLRADPRGALQTAAVGLRIGGALMTLAQGEDVTDMPGVASFAAHAPAKGVIDPEMLRNPYLALIGEGYGASAMLDVSESVSAGAWLMAGTETNAQAYGAALDWRGARASATVTVGAVEERAAMLGAHGAGALAFGDSRTLFASASGRAALGGGVALIGDAHLGRTRMASGGAYLTGGEAVSQAWTVGIEKTGLIGERDVATVAVGQELGVRSGALSLRAADIRGAFMDQSHDLSGDPAQVVRFGWRGALDGASSVALGGSARFSGNPDRPVELLGGARFQTQF